MQQIDVITELNADGGPPAGDRGDRGGSRSCAWRSGCSSPASLPPKTSTGGSCWVRSTPKTRSPGRPDRPRHDQGRRRVALRGVQGAALRVAAAVGAYGRRGAAWGKSVGGFHNYDR